MSKRSFFGLDWLLDTATGLLDITIFLQATVSLDIKIFKRSLFVVGMLLNNQVSDLCKQQKDMG